MAGSYRSHFGTGPGNLYVLFTDNIYYCNGSVVAFQIAGDSMLANITSNNRNNDIVMDFGYMGVATVNKGLLIHMLKKFDFNGYYRNLHCKEGSSRDQLDERVNNNRVTLDQETQMNVDKALETYETELGEIIEHHDKIIEQYKAASNAYASSLENIVDRLSQKLGQCLGNQASRTNKPRKPEPANDDFSVFIYRKINGVCTAKNQLPLNKDVTGKFEFGFRQCRIFSRFNFSFRCVEMERRTFKKAKNNRYFAEAVEYHQRKFDTFNE